MVYSLPDGTVVLETETERAERLAASGHGYRAIRQDATWDPTAFQPFCVAFVGAAQLDTILSDPYGLGVAFMHRRRSPSGHERLVYVRFRCAAPGNRAYSVIIMNGHALTPAGLISPLRGVPATERGDFREVDPDVAPRAGLWHVTGTLRLFAGQSDPADPSHFMIRYEYREDVDDPWRPGVIDGWLQDNER